VANAACRGACNHRLTNFSWKKYINAIATLATPPACSAGQTTVEISLWAPTAPEKFRTWTYPVEKLGNNPQEPHPSLARPRQQLFFFDAFQCATIAESRARWSRVHSEPLCVSAHCSESGVPGSAASAWTDWCCPALSMSTISVNGMPVGPMQPAEPI
jgi:hypothetical protein